MIDRTPRMSAAEYQAWLKAQAPEGGDYTNRGADVPSVGGVIDRTPAPSKFGNVRTGRSDSKKEARRLAQAELRARAGEIVGVSPQPSLVYGIDEDGKYRRVRPDRMDVLEHFEDGSMRVRFVDVKDRHGKRRHGRDGTDTETGQVKRAAMRMMGVVIVVED